MLTTLASALPTRRRLAGALLVAFALAACGAAAAPSPTPVPVVPTPKPTPTAVPGDAGGGSGGGVGTDPGSGGGSDPGSGVGGGVPLFPNQPDPVGDPLLGDARYLAPGTDLISQHPVNVQLVRAFLDDDGGVTADLRWWSGVAPCNQLDRVEIQRDDAAKTIRLTVIEGSGPDDVFCIELAELHAAVVDLGELPAGTWTISADGDTPAVKLDVP